MINQHLDGYYVHGPENMSLIISFVFENFIIYFCTFQAHTVVNIEMYLYQLYCLNIMHIIVLSSWILSSKFGTPKITNKLMKVNFLCTLRVSIDYYIISIIYYYHIRIIYGNAWTLKCSLCVLHFYTKSVYSLYLKTKYIFAQVFIVKVNFIFSTKPNYIYMTSDKKLILLFRIFVIFIFINKYLNNELLSRSVLFIEH